VSWQKEERKTFRLKKLKLAAKKERKMKKRKERKEKFKKEKKKELSLSSSLLWLFYKERELIIDTWERGRWITRPAE
jgi:hypothetical protein